MAKLQMTLEVLVSMLISLLIVSLVLGYFTGVHSLFAKTQQSLAKIANTTATQG